MSWKTAALLLGGLVFGGLVGVLIFWGGNQSLTAQRESQIPQSGQRFPDFTLESLDGNKLTFSEFVGKPVVLNFWATWCDPCKAEMPLFEEVYRQNSGIVVLGVNYNESVNVIRRFIEEREITFPILLDADGKIAEKFQVFGFPTTYFVDEDGILRGVHVGQLDEVLLSSYLEKIGAAP
ncbi:peroxiredoxin [Bellilinea caldifistulae]|uniref:TlpA family protein disulfide reductase n=1 Tax=Bellilinea caldifistulae TaxID=360411 RepID=UPI000B32FFAF|nr:TlpA disulfide reductase family protein [Bellilinea caldifistulae]GAP10903.1 peroxiredoxin [Bellilinea caldifistulae]